jgi:ferredoxin-NADP reductase
VVELETAVVGQPRRLPWLAATVAAKIPETPEATTVLFDVPGWPGHRPGQHVDVRLTAEDGYQAQRSYSIASPPEASQLALTVQRLGDGEVSPYLTDEVRAGDLIELRGPIGGYFTWTVADGGPLLLVAGGSGVAPLMAMVRHRAAAGGGPPATLLYSSRSWDEIIFRNELAGLVAADDGLAVVHTLTRSQPPGWTGYGRRVDAAMLGEVFGPPTPGAVAYACGPTPLVEGAATDLLALGYAPDRIRTERFGPSGG